MIGIGIDMELGGGLTLTQQAISTLRRLGGTLIGFPESGFAGVFTDSTGTQPVTAVNDLVGLLTDRSYGAGNLGGVELAPALSASAPWAAGTWDGTNLTIPNAGGAISYRQTAMLTGASGMHQVTVNVVSQTSVCSVANQGGAATRDLSVGVNRFLLPKGADTNLLFVIPATTTLVISALSVREVLGNHATQPTTASKPLVTQLANGTKALDFDGSNDLLTLSSGAILQQGSDHFVTAAFVLDAVGVEQGLFSIGNTANATPRTAYLNVSAGNAIRCSWQSDATVLADLVGTTVSVSTPYVATAAKIGSSYYLWLNGVLVASTTASLGTTTTNTANIGALVRTTTAFPFNGKIIDIVIDQGTLTEADRKTIERNMAQRAGVVYAG